MQIKKNDIVAIRSGKDRGKTGKVIRVDGKAGTVIVDGINLVKKHNRPKREGEKGEIVTLPRPLPMAKTSLYCGHCKRGVRTGIHFEGTSKIRYCKSCKITL